MPDATLDRPRPLYVQLRDIYAGRIARGELGPGERIPSIRDMAELHQVAPGTAERAVDLLVAEKLVTTLPGAGGTVVAGAGPEAAVPRLIFGPQQRLGFTGPVPGETTTVTSAGMADAPQHVAAILGIDAAPHSRIRAVYRREQLTTGPDGKPSRLEVSWFDPRWVSLIPALASETEPVPSLGGVAWLIAQAAEVPIVHGSHGVEARPVLDDGREMPLLRLGPGAVILAAVYRWHVPGPDGLTTAEYGEYIVPQGQVIEHDYDVDLAAAS